MGEPEEQQLAEAKKENEEEEKHEGQAESHEVEGQQVRRFEVEERRQRNEGTSAGERGTSSRVEVESTEAEGEEKRCAYLSTGVLSSLSPATLSSVCEWVDVSFANDEERKRS